MQTVIGYRHISGASSDLSETLRAFRTEALRRLAARYGDAVADEAFRLIDLHHARLRVEDPDANPIRQATAIVRGAIQAAQPGSRLDLDCILQLSISEGPTLIQVMEGAANYQDILDKLPGLEPFHFTPDRNASPSLSDTQWGDRRALWEAATPKFRLASGPRLQLLDHPLPTPKWTTVRNKLPEYQYRLTRTTQARLWVEWSSKEKTGKAAFRAWLKSADGKRAFDRAAHEIDKVLPETFEREALTAYGAPGRSKPRATAPEPLQQTPGQPGMIDHADIIESATGDVFVAVLDAGLSPKDRVFIQVAGRHLAFVQGSQDFGQIVDVPHGAIDLLRGASEVTLIEIRRSRPEEMKAQHRAIIRDVTMSAALRSGGPWKGRRTDATAS